MGLFGQRLKSLRVEIYMKQEELAKKLNVHKGTISNWENGNRFPDENILNKIADCFNVSLDYLLGRTDTKTLVIKKDIVDGKEVEIGYDKTVYPDGLTHDQVIGILENLKKMGFQLPKGKADEINE